MKEILKKLIDKWCCHHEWEIWRKVDVEGDWGNTWTVYHLVCKKCGKLKKVKSN